ncbi:ankyrin repeat and SAM domain-containing protein 4B [Gadus morhua]|uniref:Ankyrin repeat and sterile alpha motif domain containing 4B n=1 Tax=Gadus morhua TaxID=8049 RepID=A0A8C4Z948_GADMO|nr:ankyrin repeat and SAM domain-containing protein 4B-like [Gadus morhua]XP_056463501.1 ankyrin repeat and SAM domain-containing protein 4B [Gadus chalcogrammus]
MSRYHKAAIDGYLDLLKEATKKDLNTPDEDGMTPTLWAAFHGHGDALQLICSRGGDPDRCDIWGNTPLHHAANNGHMHILSFLVNFNANLFALDNEFHTAMDVAASRDRMDCVRFLDASASQRTTKDPRRVANLKKEATKEAEKRVKLCEKVKKRHQTKMDKMYQTNSGSISKHGTGAQTSTTGSLSNEQFSQLINSKPSGSLSKSVMGTLQRFGKKDKGGTLPKGGGDGNVVFGTQGNPEFLGVFSEQEENEEETEDAHRGEDDAEGAQNKLSIFNRPGLGGLTFMKKLGSDADDMPNESNENLGFLVQNEIFGAGDDDGGAGGFDADVPWEQDELGLDDELDEETSPLDTFLSTLSLQEFTMAFNREKLDLEALMLCSDDDLKGIRIQLGPRKKILEAAARRTSALSSPGKMKVTVL